MFNYYCIKFNYDINDFNNLNENNKIKYMN